MGEGRRERRGGGLFDLLPVFDLLEFNVAVIVLVQICPHVLQHLKVTDSC
jgi:hypothetical protein